MVRCPDAVVGGWWDGGVKTLMKIREFPNSPLPLPPPHRLQKQHRPLLLPPCLQSTSPTLPPPLSPNRSTRSRRSPNPRRCRRTPEPEIPDSVLKKKRSKIEPDDGEIVETAETPSEKKRKASDDVERSDTVSDAEEPVKAEVKVKVLEAKAPEPNGNGPLLKKQKVYERRMRDGLIVLDGHSVGNDGIEGVMLRDFEWALPEEQYADMEKERSAAASAADEAMVMKLFLREEKAAVEIEARQFRRMVEEKSAYDEEETGILKDIVMRRKIEKHFLEEELEGYRQ